MPEDPNETADEREQDDRFRIDVLPERPPSFTIRVQLRDGRAIMAERSEDYANLYDALVGLRDLGSKLGQRFEAEFLRAHIPTGDPRP